MFRAHQAASRRLSLTNGPLVGATVLHAAARPPRLLLTAHAFAADAASWPILIDDLATAYRQLSQGQTLDLPAPTSSFRSWVAAAGARSNGSATAIEHTFWNDLHAAIEAQDPAPIFDASAGQSAANRAMPRPMQVELDEARTAALRSEIPALHRAQIDEVLVAAIAGALCRWAGRPELWITLESASRRVELPGVDLTRTLGGCSALLPVLVHDHSDAIERLSDIKSSLRRIPSGGLHHARHASHASGAAPRITLRYLGTQPGSPGSPGSIAATLLDADLSAAPLVVSCALQGDRLVLALRHRAPSPVETDLRRLADALLAELACSIDRLRAQAPHALRPDDFAHVELDSSEVDDLFEDLA